MDDIEKSYWNHEVAEYLDIGESTLRKWCIELEKNGYIFVKGAMDSRAFTDHDLVALNHFKQLTKAKKHTKEQAAKTVVGRFLREKGVNETVPESNSENNIRSIENTLKEILKRLDQIEERENQILELVNQGLLTPKKDGE